MVILNQQNRQEYRVEIIEAIHTQNLEAFRELFLELHPTDQIEIMISLDKKQRTVVYKYLSAGEFAEIFQGLELSRQKQFFAELQQNYAIDMLNQMSFDDIADFLAELPVATKELFLSKMNRADAQEVLHLLKYPEQTAGALMTTEFIYVKEKETVSEVIEHLRKEGPDAETIYYIYVVNEQFDLVGVLSIRDLIVSPVERCIEEIMSTRVVFVDVNTDQKEVADVIKKYDFFAVPVTVQGKLVGIITVDDALDVVDEEVTEDFHKMATVSKLGKSLKDAGVFFLYRKRISWLVLLVFFNIFSGAGIAFFEDTIAAHIALVFFLPLLVDSGGNAGSQSATLMIRALATGEIRMRDWAKLFAKEISVALLLGITMALAVSMIGFYRGGIEIAIVVALSMILVVIVGSLIGMSLPFLLSRINQDPATASAPLITSLADMIGVLIYFSIAAWFLGL
ncbi:magnesium transporter [Caldalkalibacillus mannanilyticus]|uniref:magnesium transporter n=1 Tax=Caldalkalibacillus mannanilyticus TaxID=1418 RepID=UPI0004698972|nr:magnesium transporter [Caldalkalibacillus mannanilyticus]